MKIFRLVMLAIATALFAINFWTIDYSALTSSVSLWAYCRIVMLGVIIVLLVSVIRKGNKRVPVKSRTEVRNGEGKNK